MSASIACVIFQFGRLVQRLSLAQFRLNAQGQQVLVNENVPNGIVNLLQSWLNNIVIAAQNQNITQVLCNFLQLAFHVISFFQNNNGAFQEHLAVMVIDGALSLGDNPLTMSGVFNTHGINLVVVAVTTPNYVIWNYYGILAQNTGGDYMLLADAPVILARVIVSTITGESTLRQAFHYMRAGNVPVVPNHIHQMNGQNQTDDGVGDLSFDHGLSE